MLLYSNSEFPSFDVTLLKFEYLTMNNEWKTRAEFIKNNALFTEETAYKFNIVLPETSQGFRIVLGPDAGMNYLSGRVKIGGIDVYAI